MCGCYDDHSHKLRAESANPISAYLMLILIPRLINKCVIILFQVTSKPDLYPLVISYNGDAVVKTSNGSTGYLMVQYFRNFIVRPVGKHQRYFLKIILIEDNFFL